MRFTFHRNKSQLILAVGYSFLAVLLYLSLESTFHYSLDSDSVEMAVLFNQIQIHGLSFLETYHTPPDNYFFSAFPLSYIWFSIFGVTPTTIITVGWIFFLFIILLSALIVKKVAANNYAALATALILASTSWHDLLKYPGYFAYTVCHNSVWVIGLFGFFMYISYINNRKKEIYRYLFLFAVVLGTISDPWFDAAFTLPIVIGIWLTYRHNYLNRQYMRKDIVSIVLAYSIGRLIYLLIEIVGVFPSRSSHISFSNISKHYYYLSHDVAAIFSVGILPALSIPALFVLLSIAFLISGDGHNYRKASTLAYTSNDIAKSLLFNFSWLSIIGIATAMLVNVYTNSFLSARFTINIYDLTIIVLVISITSIRKSMATYILAVPVFSFLCFLLLSGINQNYYFVFSNNKYSDVWPKNLERIVDHAKQNRWGVGYAPYMGGIESAIAQAMPTFTSSPIYPISVSDHNLIVPLGVQISNVWFSRVAYHGSVPQKAYLLIPNGQIYTKKMIASASNLGGHRVIIYDGFTVLLYNHTIYHKMVTNHVYGEIESCQGNLAKNIAGIKKYARQYGVSDLAILHLYAWLINVDRPCHFPHVA